MSFSSWGDSPVRLRRAYSSRAPAVAEITGRDPSISTSFNVVRSFGTNTLVLSKWLIIGVTKNSEEWSDCSLRWKPAVIQSCTANPTKGQPQCPMDLWEFTDDPRNAQANSPESCLHSLHLKTRSATTPVAPGWTGTVSATFQEIFVRNVQSGSFAQGCWTNSNVEFRVARVCVDN